MIFTGIHGKTSFQKKKMLLIEKALGGYRNDTKQPL